jgi:hypothetical protein
VDEVDQINKDAKDHNYDADTAVDEVKLYVKGGPIGDTPVPMQSNFDEKRYNFGGIYSWVARYTCAGYQFTYNIQMSLVNGLNTGTQAGVNVWLSEVSGNGVDKKAESTLSLGPNDLRGISSSCILPNLNDSSFKKNNALNFNKLSDANKANWPSVAAAADTAGQDPSNDPDAKDCTAPGGFGWIVCGMIDLERKAIDWIESNFIKPFLDTPRLSFSDTTTNPLYQIWKDLRNISNVLFVLIFIVIVFANVFGLQNYNVKKALPKLVVAAILVQASFLLMAVAIDITNVLGGGLMSLVNQLIPTASNGPNASEGAATATTIGATVLVTGLLAAHIFSVGILTALMPLFFGMLAVFFTLVFRQTLITALIMISPIAISAMVLPGTEKMFKSWMNLFIKSLLMYPLIVLMFAAGKIAAYAATTASTSPVQSAFAPIVAMLCMALPLLAVPFAFSFAGGIMGRIGKATLGATGRIRKGVAGSDLNQNRIENRKKRATYDAVAGQAPKYFGKLPGGAAISRMRAGVGPFNTAGAQDKLARQKNKYFEDDRKTASGIMSEATTRYGVSGTQKENLLAAIAAGRWDSFSKGTPEHEVMSRLKKTSATRTAALEQLVKSSSYNTLAALRPNMAGPAAPAAEQQIWQDAVGTNFGDVNKAAPDVATGSFDGLLGDGKNPLGSISGESLKNLHYTTVDRYFDHVAPSLSAAERQLHTDNLMRAVKQAKTGRGNVDPRIMRKLHQNAHMFSDAQWIRNNIDGTTGAFV